MTLIQKDKTFEVDALVGKNSFLSCFLSKKLGRNLMNALEKTVNKPLDEEVFGMRNSQK